MNKITNEEIFNALKLFFIKKQVSIVLLCKYFKITFGRAIKIVEELENFGYIQLKNKQYLLNKISQKDFELCFGKI